MREGLAPLCSYRVLAAAISYASFGVFASIPAVFSWILRILPISSARRQKATRAMIRLLCRAFVWQMHSLRLYRFQLNRRWKTQPTGHLIVANHPMLLDAVFVMAHVHNVCCIAKPELASNPFMGLTLRQAGFVVSTENQLIDSIAAKLRAGENVLIFPEGTRNQWDTQLDFKRGAANIAVIAGCPILPVVLECNPPALKKHQKWYEVPAERAEIKMTVHAPLALADCIDTSKPRTIQYRRLTEFLRCFFLEQLIQSVENTKPEKTHESAAAQADASMGKERVSQ